MRISALSFMIALVIFVAPTLNATEPKPIFPTALAPGDTIEIIAPAKYLDHERVTLATKRLEEMGFKVRIPQNLFRKKRIPRRLG